ncbi:type I-F CRISPR-associated protein Csy2 [Isoalcanivorax beigongshangi]|uniref:Type I-F CRISPR-associated protein Csy2 n=1 Tax=Isoalcanivorax beigongshangi TaxID=3238810 RepID=A0ABV4AJY1_9GAMM
MNEIPLSSAQGLLVVPHLRVQNANAISSQMTHGFPSITAFVGLMWALERKLAAEPVPLRLLKVGVICHAQQEQVNSGYVKTFRLTRNPVGRDGGTAGIVEEGRTHLELTLVFLVQQKRVANVEPVLLTQVGDDVLNGWAQHAADTLAGMRVAGGSVLPPVVGPGRMVRPWLRLLADDPDKRARQFRQWRRQWLPGFALVGRDDVLAEWLTQLQTSDPDATALDAWLELSRFNYRADPHDANATAVKGSVRWRDPQRGKGSGWLVPIPVGYVGLSALHGAGQVRHARDERTPLRFVESVYSIGEWVSPHRITDVEALLWQPEVDHAKALYRCRSGYGLAAADDPDDDFYDYD